MYFTCALINDLSIEGMITNLLVKPKDGQLVIEKLRDVDRQNLVFDSRDLGSMRIYNYSTCKIPCEIKVPLGVFEYDPVSSRLLFEIRHENITVGNEPGYVGFYNMILPTNWQMTKFVVEGLDGSEKEMHFNLIWDSLVNSQIVEMVLNSDYMSSATSFVIKGTAYDIGNSCSCDVSFMKSEMN